MSLPTTRATLAVSPAETSRTETTTETAPDAVSQPSGSRPPDGVLRLRGGPKRRDGPRVTWGEEVIDNEGCGKKKSKICCIYHKQRAYDESSDESDDESGIDGSPGHSQHHHKPGGPQDNAYERKPRDDVPHGEGGSGKP